MSAWLRLLGFFLLVVLVAVFLRVIPPLLFIVGLIGGGTYAWWRLRNSARDEAEAGGVTALGLQRAAEDPFGIATFPLALLSRGTDGVLENVVWGPWHHRELRAFEFRYSPGPGLDDNRFLCALVGVDVDNPVLVIEPVTFLTLPSEQIDLPAVASGDGHFDRAFGVRGDPGFARALLDDRMRGWMLGLGEDLAFEVTGRLVACYSKRMTDDLMPLLLALAGFLDRMPKGSLGAGASASKVAPERPDRD